MRLVKVRDDMPLDRGALIGCGVTTGVGAVLNTAKRRARHDGGGVRLPAASGWRPSRARSSPVRGMIIAVDVVASKLETAKRLGATDAVDGVDGRPGQRASGR